MPGIDFDRIRAIIVRELDVDPEVVTPEAKLRGRRLRADSLDLVMLIIAFASEFNVEMKDEEVQQIVTVGDIAVYLEKYVGSSQ